jgi:hypothetical protein
MCYRGEIMAGQQLLSGIKNMSGTKIGRNPVVVLPLKVWREIEDCLEDMEIEQSRRLERKISAARRAKKSYSAAQVKKFAGL